MRTLLLAALLAASLPVLAADEGIELGGAQTVRVTGHVFDAETKQPIYGAQVSVEDDYTTERSDTGPQGDFYLTAASDRGFGLISVAVNHTDYQQKYLATLLRDELRHDVEVRVMDGRAHVKSKKIDREIRCGERIEVPTRDGGSAPIVVVCEDGRTGVEMGLHESRIAVLAEGPFTLRIENGRLAVEDSKNSVVDLHVEAAMHLRR